MFDLDEDIYLFAFKLVATVWNNQITSPDDISERIVYEVKALPEVPEPMRNLFRDLFSTKLTRWLRREGHPKSLVGTVISEEMDKKSLQSPHTTRAELFWKAVSDLHVLPASSVNIIRVSGHHVTCTGC